MKFTTHSRQISKSTDRVNRAEAVSEHVWRGTDLADGAPLHVALPTTTVGTTIRGANMELTVAEAKCLIEALGTAMMERERLTGVPCANRYRVFIDQPDYAAVDGFGMVAEGAFEGEYPGTTHDVRAAFAAALISVKVVGEDDEDAG